MTWTEGTVVYERGTSGAVSTFSGLIELTHDDATLDIRRGFLRTKPADKNVIRHVPADRIIEVNLERANT